MTDALQGKEMVTPFVSMRIEGNIMFCEYADDLHLSIEVARACVESRIFFSRGKSFFLSVDMRGVKSTTKEARTYLATMGTTLASAGALITGSALNRALGNIFLKIDRPAIPAKLFTSEEKARKWLMKLQEEMVAH